jgi:formylglycine-generating enzyme required for sulfatase activity
MHGNVWEWCQDRYANYSSGAQSDPTGAERDSGRVDRGGGFDGSAGYCRSAFRVRISPGIVRYDLGARPARSLP